MQVGVIYPQSELPTDPATVRTFARGIERLGFRHILAFDHVVGADPTVHADWRGPYDVDTTFHEPLVFYGFLAAITDVELVTGIIIAPQRQTALLAKQAAEVDLLTGGRFRLGIGTGWNFVEYEALGQDFAHARQARGGADHAAAAPLDRAQHHARGFVRPGHRCGHLAAPDPAAHPRVARRQRTGRVPPRRTSRRRLVPSAAAGCGPR